MNTTQNTQFTHYALAEQVQRQNGQIVAKVRGIDLRPASAPIYRLNPQAARQARDGQLFMDAYGLLYVNPTTEAELDRQYALTPDQAFEEARTSTGCARDWRVTAMRP